MQPLPSHVSVLLRQTVDLLAPKAGDAMLDVTLGLGGHAEAMLKAAGDSSTLVGLDADEKNLAFARERLAPFGKQATLVHANFRELPDCLPEDLRTFDVIVADLGLSSPHIDDPARGFTFREDAPLDMRFDQTKGSSAAMLLASLDRESLKEIFAKFGEFKHSHVLVDIIINRRKEKPVRTSNDLRDAASEAYGRTGGDLLPQIFQALRIGANKEMQALETLLEVAPTLLKPGGRFAVISYHSLEDRLVKLSFRRLTEAEKDPVTGSPLAEAEFESLTKKSIAPDADELQQNPRSRSARLRGIVHKPAYTHARS